MIYLIILTIYLLSVFAMYKWIQIAYYHKNGIFKGLEPDNDDLFLTFVPFINTVAAIICWISHKSKKSNTNFFKPKNYDKNP